MKSPSCPLGNDWKLDAKTSDEFDGPKLNAKKWMDVAPGWRGRREFIYRSQNVATQNGFLMLTTRKATYMEPEDAEAGFWPYESAVIKSRKKVRYGYFECSAKGAAAEIRNAFWLYDPLSDRLDEKYRPGNCSEEIDIYEMIGLYRPHANTNYGIGAHVHRFATPYVEGLVNSQKTALPQEGGWLDIDWKPADEFHTYGLLWNQNVLIWYCDGREFFRRDNDYFHTPLHIMFNTEIAEWRGALKGEINHKEYNPERMKTLDEQLPACHQVDYFRRWIPRNSNDC